MLNLQETRPELMGLNVKIDSSRAGRLGFEVCSSVNATYLKVDQRREKQTWCFVHVLWVCSVSWLLRVQNSDRRRQNGEENPPTSPLLSGLLAVRRTDVEVCVRGSNSKVRKEKVEGSSESPVKRGINQLGTEEWRGVFTRRERLMGRRGSYPSSEGKKKKIIKALLLLRSSC